MVMSMLGIAEKVFPVAGFPWPLLNGSQRRAGGHGVPKCSICGGNDPRCCCSDSLQAVSAAPALTSCFQVTIPVPSLGARVLRDALNKREVQR